jgi:hypothetical protein
MTGAAEMAVISGSGQPTGTGTGMVSVMRLLRADNGVSLCLHA